MNNSVSQRINPTDDFRTILNDLRVKEGNELVNEFIKIFSSRIPSDISYLVEARNNENFVELKQKSHFLSTTLLTLKFNHGFTLSSGIEKAIDTDLGSSALVLTDELIEYLNDALKEIP